MRKAIGQYKKVNRKVQEEKLISSDYRFQLPCPLSLAATAGDSEGEIDLVWEPVDKAHTYVIQKSNDSQQPKKWINEDIVSKSSYTITKLKSSKKYWFRVSAVGQKGQGPWSKPVQKKAP